MTTSDGEIDSISFKNNPKFQRLWHHAIVSADQGVVWHGF